MNLNEIRLKDSVIVKPSCFGHEFKATVVRIYEAPSPKLGMLVVTDQDDDSFDVEPCEILAIIKPRRSGVGHHR